MRSGRSTPWSVWWVLLLAALLPLRAWAVVSMPINVAGSSPAAPMPCHAAAADDHGHHSHHDAAPALTGLGADASPDGGAHPAGHGDDHANHDSAAGHTCASCVLCHSPLAAEAEHALPGPAPRAGALVPSPSRDTGRLLAETLERPPRG
ncbi:MAG: hypothetical protein LW854_10375 [Rubrivivax sp.]|nr:hypothetical protein [Rubrivivax sp.]